MDWTIIPADGWAFFAAAIGGLVLGTITAAASSKDSPVWPVRLYLELFRNARKVPTLRRYADERSVFPFREQLLASWFIWFFIIFGISIFILG